MKSIIECLRKWEKFEIRLLDFSKIFGGQNGKPCFILSKPYFSFENRIFTDIHGFYLANFRDQISESRRNREIYFGDFPNPGGKFPNPGVNLGNIRLRKHSNSHHFICEMFQDKSSPYRGKYCKSVTKRNFLIKQRNPSKSRKLNI
jgi:hypothetical protein